MGSPDGWVGVVAGGCGLGPGKVAWRLMGLPVEADGAARGGIEVVGCGGVWAGGAEWWMGWWLVQGQQGEGSLRG